MAYTPNTPKTECPKCLGCGRIDSRDGLPWCEVTATVNQDVRAGFISPKECPQCDGRGNCDIEETKPATVETKPAKPPKPSAEKPAATK